MVSFVHCHVTFPRCGPHLQFFFAKKAYQKMPTSMQGGPLPVLYTGVITPILVGL